MLSVVGAPVACCAVCRRCRSLSEPLPSVLSVPYVSRDGMGGQNHFASMPVALYGGRSFICFICFICLKIAYFILTRTLIFYLGQKSMLAAAIGKDTKGLALLVVYFVSISLSFPWPLAACAGYVLVAVMWLLPDPRIEKRLREGE